MEIIKKIFLILAIIGALNWGLIGLFDFNLVEYLVGTEGILRTIIYVLVGIGGLIAICYLFDSDHHDK